jgi:hypothetical protein
MADNQIKHSWGTPRAARWDLPQLGPACRFQLGAWNSVLMLNTHHIHLGESCWGKIPYMEHQHMGSLSLVNW